MDRQDKAKILESVLDRAYAALNQGGQEPSTIKTLAEGALALESLLDFQLSKMNQATFDYFSMQQSEASMGDTEPVTPKPEPETTTSTTENAMSKEELREQVAALANKYPALDAFSLMQEMGYSKLSDIPAGRRSEYLEKVKAAVAEVA